LKKWIGLGLFGVAVLVLAGLLGERPRNAGPSSLSHSSVGWLAARRYWEASGARVTLLGRSLTEQKPEGTLVLTFPEDFRGKEDFDAIRHELTRGRTLLLAFSGEGRYPLEALLWESVGAPLKQVRGDPPLSPKSWYRFATEVWNLRAESGAGTVREVRVSAPRWVPQPPAASQILFRAPDGTPMIFQFARRGGRVLALPADALSNGRVETPGNADLLETLRVALGPAFTFDEFHHGFSLGPSVVTASSVVSFDLLLLQLLLLYLLAALALGRRFGLAWKQMPARAGSTAAFFVGLAARHRRLRHFRPAAELLVSRSRQLDASVSLPPDVDPDTVDDERSFLEFSRRVSELASHREGSR
jgi:uncharacterized protein DUF4350